MTARHDKATELAAAVREAQSKVRSFIYSMWGHAGDDRVKPVLAALDKLEALATYKATEGRTEAAAVDQAIADVRENVKRIRDNVGFALAERNIPREPTWTLLTPQALDNIDAALRVLADAVEALRGRVYVLENMRSENYIETLEAAEAENVRLARQVADLEAALRKIENFKHPLGQSTRGSLNTVQAIAAAARSRDPQAQPSADREEPQT